MKSKFFAIFFIYSVTFMKRLRLIYANQIEE